MQIEQTLKNKLRLAFKIAFDQELENEKIVIERSKEKLHGDYSSNLAMQAARILKQNPLLIAEKIVREIDKEGIEKIEIINPGFINFFIKKEIISSIVQKILTENEKFGHCLYGEKKRINVEFVSANPTGDLHLGHARGAAIGDTICRLYEKVGFEVIREYYVNDAGNQIDNLGKSLQARYEQLFGLLTSVPEDGYHGEDLKNIALLLKKEIGDKYVDKAMEAFPFFKKRGVEMELDKINLDLQQFRVRFDKFSFETEVKKAGGIEKVLEKVKDYIYCQDGAILLKTTTFGDDKDRVIIKSDGNNTYFLPDIAYHLEKLSYGYDLLIDVLGADHHGYISRMKGAMQMFGYPASILEIELIQMVRLFKNGEEYKMSKRTGNAIAMRELCDEVGVDAARYFFVSRAASAHLDFDLDLAVETSSANPVYYAQYAHARLSSVLESGKDIPLSEDCSNLVTAPELDLMKHLSEYGDIVLDAALTRSPYKVTIFIQKLASLIHSFYTECRLLDYENIPITSSRLALSKASQIVMKSALNLIGVNAPVKM